MTNATIQFLPYLLTGLLVAQCYLLTQQLNHALMIGRSMIALVNKQRTEFEEKIAEVEVDSFAAGWEACSEEAQGEADFQIEVRDLGMSSVRCGCVRCRERAWAVN